MVSILLKSMLILGLFSTLTISCASDEDTDDVIEGEEGDDNGYEDEGQEDGQGQGNEYGEGEEGGNGGENYANGQAAQNEEYGEDLNNAAANDTQEENAALAAEGQQAPIEEGENYNSDGEQDYALQEPGEQPAIDADYGTADASAGYAPVAAPGGRVMYARSTITLYDAPQGSPVGTLEQGDHPLIWTADSVAAAGSSYEPVSGEQQVQQSGESIATSYETVEQQSTQQQPSQPASVDTSYTNDQTGYQEEEGQNTQQQNSNYSNGANSDYASKGYDNGNQNYGGNENYQNYGGDNYQLNSDDNYGGNQVAGLNPY